MGEDQEVADVLGMSKAAFSARKKRGSFPENELYALAAKHPDLGLDVGYVMTGKSAKQTAQEALENFPSRLVEVRGRRSQEKFAAILGITVEQLRMLEKGTEKPTLPVVTRLIESHPDNDVAWLLGESSPGVEVAEGLEATLLQNYRNSSPEAQEAMRVLAAFHAQYAVRLAEKAIPVPSDNDEIDLIRDYKE